MWTYQMNTLISPVGIPAGHVTTLLLNLVHNEAKHAASCQRWADSGPPLADDCGQLMPLVTRDISYSTPSPPPTSAPGCTVLQLVPYPYFMYPVSLHQTLQTCSTRTALDGQMSKLKLEFKNVLSNLTACPRDVLPLK